MTAGVDDLETALRRLLASGALELPLPGAGATAERLARLSAIAAADLQVGRLVEAHTDATAILAEAGRIAGPGVLYGVWAAEAPGGPGLRLESGPHGPHLVGIKTFCSGAGIVDRALLPVQIDRRSQLLDIDVRSGELSFDCSTWRTTAFDATNTATVTFDRLPVEPGAAVGAPGWYLERIGFWHGATGPAACWAGGISGLIDRSMALARAAGPDPHRDAQLGELDTIRWLLTAVLSRAGWEIDHEASNWDGARRRALRLRHLVERAAAAAIDATGRMLGPRALSHDEWIIRRVAEVQLYVRQHHSERDLATLCGSVSPPGGR